MPNLLSHSLPVLFHPWEQAELLPDGSVLISYKDTFLGHLVSRLRVSSLVIIPYRETFVIGPGPGFANKKGRFFIGPE